MIIVERKCNQDNEIFCDESVNDIDENQINDTSDIKNRKRYDYETVKKLFESRGYKLISTTYIRSTDKLSYICPKGHLGTVTLKNFKNNNTGCGRCSRPKPKSKYEKSNKQKPKKYTIEFIKKTFEDEGYIVHTDKYINSMTKIEFTCPNNHRGSMLFYAFFIEDRRCNACKYLKMADQFKTDINKIKEEFTKLNFVLLTDHNTNSRAPIKFICPNNHETEMAYSAWKNSDYKCYPCYLEELRKSKAFTYEHVKKIFDDKNCILLTQNYINAKQSLIYICSIGHYTNATLDGFTRVEHTLCGYCSQVYKKTIEEVRTEFKKVGYTLTSTEYINAKTPLEFICNNGHKHQMTWTHFDQGERCAKCISNRGIDACTIYLDQIDVSYELEYKFPDCKNIRPLPFDIYVNKTFLLERDGKHHFFPADWFGGIDAFITQTERDNIKTMYCINNNIPLLRISYKELKQTPILIKNFINQLKTRNKSVPLVSFSNSTLYEKQIKMYNEASKKYKKI